MRITKVTTITKDVKCCGECPYLEFNGGPSPPAECGHPDVKKSKNLWLGIEIIEPEWRKKISSRCPERGSNE